MPRKVMGLGCRFMVLLRVGGGERCSGYLGVSPVSPDSPDGMAVTHAMLSFPPAVGCDRGGHCGSRAGCHPSRSSRSPYPLASEALLSQLCFPTP